MKNNLKASVIAAIAETQDGGKLIDRDHFSRFILYCIQENTRMGFVDTENLAGDLRYMINQLKKAVRPIESYNNKVSS
jgi:prenyltransferase beta subunit